LAAAHGVARSRTCDVPFCRAANGALAASHRQRPYLVMEQLRILRQWIERLGAQRWGKEIVLAVLLTVAAVAFIATAILGSDTPVDGKAPYETATKPLPQ